MLACLSFHFSEHLDPELASLSDKQVYYSEGLCFRRVFFLGLLFRRVFFLGFKLEARLGGGRALH